MARGPNLSEIVKRHAQTLVSFLFFRHRNWDRLQGQLGCIFVENSNRFHLSLEMDFAVDYRARDHLIIPSRSAHGR